MKFSMRRDTELTSHDLFEAITDFDRLERILTRRGAAVVRTRDGGQDGTGPAWDIGFDWRGRHRDLKLTVTTLRPSEQMLIEGLSEAFEVTIEATVLALSLSRSRLIFETDLRPRTMRARLILQTAKLGKSQLDAQFDRGVRQLLSQMTADRA